MDRATAELGYLKGKLLADRWLHNAAWKPHRFPVTYGTSTADNLFSRALAATAHLLARASSTQTVRARLLLLALALRPGSSDAYVVPPSATAVPLPPQWSVYQPAWSVACAMLNRRSLLGAKGSLAGVSISILAWPLLERRLQRGLHAAVRLAATHGRSLYVVPKRSVTLLTGPHGSAVGSRTVEPDGELAEGGATVATFEAKYADYVPGHPDWPRRQDYFQALCTASACDAPVSVLVYPGLFKPAGWSAPTMGAMPKRIVALGSDLFCYRTGQGDDVLGRRILSALDIPAGSWDSAVGNDAVAA